ncbi:MAG TPA: RMD1 family protein [Rhodospirillales bacterium]
MRRAATAMIETLLSKTKTIPIRALLIGERIDVRAFGQADRLATGPMLVRAGNNRAAAVLRYGAVVLFNMSPDDEAAFIEALRPFVTEPYNDWDAETATVSLRAGDEGPVDAGGTIYLSEITVERLQIVATVLAKSMVLAFYEKLLASVFDRIEPLARSLGRRGHTGREGRALLRQIGDVLLMQHKMVGRVEVAEKPDLLWDHPELERLYARLQDEFELNDRARALDRKLDLISRTAATSLDLLQNRRTLRVEWYIVILIVIELVLLVLYETFMAPRG